MKPIPTHVHSLCPECSSCPAVEIYDDGTVTIGEAPNVATLKRHEWNELVKAIETGALGALA